MNAANASFREALQNSRENPLAAAAIAAAVSGSAPAAQNNVENLLDIDFDGAAPASAQKAPQGGLSGLEGLAGTPQRSASPEVSNGEALPPPNNNFDDLMGLSDSMGGVGFGTDMGLSQSNQDILNGFASLNMNAGTQPPPPQQQLSSGGAKKTTEDLLGLF
jgi:AP-1 complex subunit beta-1